MITRLGEANMMVFEIITLAIFTYKLFAETVEN